MRFLLCAASHLRLLAVNYAILIYAGELVFCSLPYTNCVVVTAGENWLTAIEREFHMRDTTCYFDAVKDAATSQALWFWNYLI